MFLKSHCLISTKLDINADLTGAEAIKKIRLQYPAIRRADRYTAMIINAAVNGLAQANVAFPLGDKTALLVVSAFGPSRTTFSMIDEIIEYPENEILPTKFSHSVLNAALSYLALVAGVQGDNYALCGFDDAFFDAVVLADSLLRNDRIEQVLLVGCDETNLLSEILNHVLPEFSTKDAEDCDLAMLLTRENCGRELFVETPENARDEGRGTRDEQLETHEESSFYFGVNKDFLRQLSEENGKLTLRKTKGR